MTFAGLSAGSLNAEAGVGRSSRTFPTLGSDGGAGQRELKFSTLDGRPREKEEAFLAKGLLA